MPDTKALSCFGQLGKTGTFPTKAEPKQSVISTHNRLEKIINLALIGELDYLPGHRENLPRPVCNR